MNECSSPVHVGLRFPGQTPEMRPPLRPRVGYLFGSTLATLSLLMTGCAQLALPAGPRVTATPGRDTEGRATREAATDPSTFPSGRTRVTGGGHRVARTAFIAPDAIDFRGLLSPPPPPDSIVARHEQELMAHLKAARTADEAKLAKYYENLDVFKVLVPVLGAGCTAKNLPHAAALFRQAYADARPAIRQAKVAWNRPRPRDGNAVLHAVTARPSNSSYPSGHATEAELFAVLLTELVPERAADWAEQSARVRWSRVVGGSHYPSDTVAGRTLGEAIGRRMLQSPLLRAKLAPVRAELAPFLQKKAG